MKQRIVFIDQLSRLRESEFSNHLVGSGNVLYPSQDVLRGNLSEEERKQLLKKFESKKIDTLIVTKGFITGWRVKVSEDDVNFIFMGTWNGNEIKQAMNRVYPSKLLARGETRCITISDNSSFYDDKGPTNEPN